MFTLCVFSGVMLLAPECFLCHQQTLPFIEFIVEIINLIIPIIIFRRDVTSRPAGGGVSGTGGSPGW